MKNIVIVGDSFCAADLGWPTILAESLKLNLICHGFAGMHWWPAASVLNDLHKDTVANTSVLIVCHTYADRIPNADSAFSTVDRYSDSAKTEIELATNLYYKYIADSKFLAWAQQQWVNEIDTVWVHAKVIHLHCFPWSTHLDTINMSVTPSLAALSLNESGATEFYLANDPRLNHFSTRNNTVLANELVNLIENYTTKPSQLTVPNFDQQTFKWLDWK